MDHQRRPISRSLFPLALPLIVFALSCEAPLPTAAPGSEGGDATQTVLSGKKAGPTFDPLCTDCAVEVVVDCGKSGKISLKGVGKSKKTKKSKKSDKEYRSGPELKLAVMGTGEFDISTVDLSTIRIGDAATTPATPVMQQDKKDEYRAKVKDLNGDGILDLDLRFSLREMSDNGNISESTTSICLIGSGPGFDINGCADLDDCGVDGGNGGNGGNPGGGFTVTRLVPFGNLPEANPLNKSVWVAWIAKFADAEDPIKGYPGWTGVDISVLEASGGLGPWAGWSQEITPFGNEELRAIGFLAGCGLSRSTYKWPMSQQILIRRDVVLTPGSKKMVIDFLVDDEARVYVNGVEVTTGFQSAQYASCASYGQVVTIKVPDSLLSPDGVNEIAVWATDTKAYVNFFDMQITASVAN